MTQCQDRICTSKGATLAVIHDVEDRLLRLLRGLQMRREVQFFLSNLTHEYKAQIGVSHASGAHPLIGMWVSAKTVWRISKRFVYGQPLQAVLESDSKHNLSSYLRGAPWNPSPRLCSCIRT